MRTRSAVRRAAVRSWLDRGPDRRPAGRPGTRRTRGTRQARRPSVRGRVIGHRRAHTTPRDRSRGDGAVAPSGLDHHELRLLAELLGAGVPLLTSLATLAAHGRSAGRRRALAISHDLVAGGGSISSAIGGVASHVVAIVSAGERVGRLAEAVAAAADLEDRLAAVRRRVTSALAYPALVLVVAIVVIAVLMATVVPEVESTYRDLGGDLPTATRLVVALAGFLTSPVAAITIALLVATAGARSRLRAAQGVRSHGGLPGPLGRALATAVAARVMATLLANGVPLLTALDAAAAGTAHPDVRELLTALAERVARGGLLADSPDLGRLLADTDRAIIAVGEERGLLAAQWERVAARRLQSVESGLETVGTLAEPVLVLVVGGVVGAVITALYLPSFRVLELL